MKYITPEYLRTSTDFIIAVFDAHSRPVIKFESLEDENFSIDTIKIKIVYKNGIFKFEFIHLINVHVAARFINENGLYQWLMHEMLKISEEVYDKEVKMLRNVAENL